MRLFICFNDTARTNSFFTCSNLLVFTNARYACTLDNMINDNEIKAVLQSSEMLKMLSNSGRLQIMCKLAQKGEMSVNDLTAYVGLSQSALSQHLAKLRSSGLLQTRRDGQNIYYKLASTKAKAVIACLKLLYCPQSS